MGVIKVLRQLLNDRQFPAFYLGQQLQHVRHG
jgi:hypothetical protein